MQSLKRMRIHSTPQPQECLNIMNTARNNWAHLNNNDVSNSWAAPSVGIFWCDQTSVDVDPDPT
eukprot:2063773-Heterocapsa_arctica.AAC.1